MVFEAERGTIRLFEPTFEPWRARGSDRDVAVMMSGGVDSSLTALLLKESGWNVVGITMKIPIAEHCSRERSCCGADAAFVCHDVGIPHYFVDVEEVFKDRIIEPFRRAYSEGRTPNPCVDCNTALKFGLVWDLIESALGIRYAATGHYARVVHEDTKTFLTTALDRKRDQSYFIYGIPLARLPYLLLPLGDLEKTMVREKAAEKGLRVAEKTDSMEICFAGEGDYRDVLDVDESRSRGPILSATGEVLGYHDGIHNYTVGQRRGLRFAAGYPVYVLKIDPAGNSVVVGTKEEVHRRYVGSRNTNVLIPEEAVPGKRLYGKIRSYGVPASCTITKTDEHGIDVEFETPQFAPTPGQRLVVYDTDGRIVFGGEIRNEE